MCDVGLPVDEEITQESRRQLFWKEGSSVTSQYNVRASADAVFCSVSSQGFYVPQRSEDYRKLERELYFNADDGALYETKLAQLPFLYERLPRAQHQFLKIAKDIPRTSFLPGALGRDVVQLFLEDFESGAGLYAFLQPEAAPLNRVLFQTAADFSFQVDCLVLYKIQLAASELLGHYQQGYNDLACVVMNFLLDQLIVGQDLHIFEPSSDAGAMRIAKDYPRLSGISLQQFIVRTTQVTHLFLARLQPVLQMFTVAPQKAQRQRQNLSHQFYALLKDVDQTLHNFLQKVVQKDQIILHLMEWILSLFARIFYPQHKQQLLDIWRDLIREPTPKNALRHCCVVLSQAKGKLFERCGVLDETEYARVYGAQGMEFLQAIGAWAAPHTD